VSKARQANYDTVILGGGVAALWTANVLKAAGQSVLVLTNAPLGSGQSLAAQGVIHGGLKYAVGGKLTDASEALAAMPSRWLAAMRGEGGVDLRCARLLSDHQILWSLPSVVSQVIGFFGSKAVRGRSSAVPREDYPPVFATPLYKGRLFRIDEPVVDPVSVIRELAKGVREMTFRIDWGSNAVLCSGAEGVSHLHVTDDDGTQLEIRARTFLFAAGAGNADLLARIGRTIPAMQRRPLHQVVVRKVGLPDFYSVCVGTGPKPPLVSTTHVDSQGRTVWYFGGELAEQGGVARSEAEQIDFTKALLARLLPWIDLAGSEWFTWRGDRAEPLTGTGDRPPGAWCQREGNVLVAWPTKFALAPDLGDQVLRETGTGTTPAPPPLALPRPVIGVPPWEQA